MIKIRWWGHSCFEISSKKSIVTDPHDGISIGIPPPKAKADYILITHDHFDHNQSRIVEKEDSIIIRETANYDDIQIKAIKAYHDKSKGDKRGFINTLKFVYDDFTFCHLGDIGHILEADLIAEIGEIDILFIPVGGFFTIDAKDALKLSELINTRVIIPMHYKIEGLSLPIENLDPFIDNSSYNVHHVANQIDIEREDISQEKEIWVFSL